MARQRRRTGEVNERRADIAQGTAIHRGNNRAEVFLKEVDYPAVFKSFPLKFQRPWPA